MTNFKLLYNLFIFVSTTSLVDMVQWLIHMSLDCWMLYSKRNQNLHHNNCLYFISKNVSECQLRVVQIVHQNRLGKTCTDARIATITTMATVICNKMANSKSKQMLRWCSDVNKKEI